MPSIFWNRNPEEAYRNPYEYSAQKQFLREARKLLKSLFKSYDRFNLTFSCEDQSLRKAIWMLQHDALDSLRDCLESLVTKRHRIAGRLFRDVIETLDLAAYFHSDSPQAKKQLGKWYKDEVIPHRVYRDYIRVTVGIAAEKERRDFYCQLSKFTHRTYRALLKGYSLGRDDLMVYDSHCPSRSLVLPQTISAFYAILADLITLFCDEASARGIVTQGEIDQAQKASLETTTVPRRFAQR
jgi:hypothetical protein